MSTPHEEIGLPPIGLPPVDPTVMTLLVICLMLGCIACGASVVFDGIRSVFFHIITRHGASDWTIGRIAFAISGIPLYIIFRELRAAPGMDPKA